MKSPLGLWETGRKGGFAVKTHRLSLPSEAIFKKRKKKKEAGGLRSTCRNECGAGCRSCCSSHPFFVHFV